MSREQEMNRLIEILENRSSARLKAKLKYSRHRLGLPAGMLDGNFHCVHCGQPVAFDPLASGVQNRNHCPYCLWSKHLDLGRAGDRLAACKAPMRPVGLSLKRIGKKYGCQRGGELMVIHLCVECRKANLNRIAADDSNDALWSVFEESARLDPGLSTELQQTNILALGYADFGIVKARLYGLIER